MSDLGHVPANGPIILAEIQEFEIGGMRVRPAGLTIEMDGQIIELQPRVMQVLVALAESRPNVLSRDRLSERCWNGRIVGDDALNRCIVALRHLAKDFSPEPFAIETVARVGYSLVEAPTEGGKSGMAWAEGGIGSVRRSASSPCSRWYWSVQP